MIPQPGAAPYSLWLMPPAATANSQVARPLRLPSSVAPTLCLLRLQQIGQGRDVPDPMEVVDDFEARLDAPIGQSRMRHQGAIFSIDVVPGDAPYPRPLWRIDRARRGPAIHRTNGHGCPLPITLDILGRRGADADFVNQPMDHRISNLFLCCMGPRQTVICGAGGQEIGRTMRHSDQIRRMERAGERGDT